MNISLTANELYRCANCVGAPVIVSSTEETDVNGVITPPAMDLNEIAKTTRVEH